MKLLDAQEAAVKRAQEKHELINRYNQILTQLETKKKELRAIETELNKLSNEILTYLHKL